MVTTIMNSLFMAWVSMSMEVEEEEEEGGDGGSGGENRKSGGTWRSHYRS